MLRVLTAEDPLLIADLLEETVVASSYEVWAIARTVDQGVPLGKMHQPDLPFSICGLRRGDRPRSPPFRSQACRLSERPNPCCCSTRADFRRRQLPGNRLTLRRPTHRADR